jgi:hypothetical protein
MNKIILSNQIFEHICLSKKKKLNIRTTLSKIESRSSFAATCAFPRWAIRGDTGLTTNNVPAIDISFLRFYFGNRYFFSWPFMKCRSSVPAWEPWIILDLDEFKSFAWALILDVIISWIVGRNLWLVNK